MNTQKKIQLNITVPERYRDLLRRIAAEKMMCDPSEVTSASSVAAEILLKELNNIGKFDCEEEGRKND